MGKNKNKHSDMWDLSFEEQQALLNNFEEMLSKPVEDNTECLTAEDEITDNVEGSNEYSDPITSTLWPDDDDYEILDVAIDTGDSDIIIAENPVPIATTVEETTVEEEPVVDEKKPTIDDISIKFDYIYALDKLIIDDGTTKKTFAINRAVEDNIYDITDNDFDDEQVSDNSSLLLGYIITCQHPYAVVPASVFERDFKSVTEFDFKSYIFVNVDAFVCIYVMSEKNRDTLLSLARIYEMTRSECMNFWISLSYHCGIVNNAFYVENSEYISEFMNMTADNYDIFKEIFFNDPTTVVGDSESDISEYIDDCKFVQTTARKFLSSIVDDDDEDDDDDLDDEYDVEYDDDEDDGEETKVSARDLYMETMQKANIIKSQDANTEEKDDGDDDDMTFTVITRD